MPRSDFLRSVVLSLGFVLGCGDGGRPAGPLVTDRGRPATGADSGASAAHLQMSPPGSSSEGLARSTRPDLQWKRYAAFEADLAGALALPTDSLCKEFGQVNCIRGVHLSPLGGHDPFASGLLESSAEPLATTPTVVERIVLSACARRAELDRSAGSSGAEVFKGLDLASATPPPADRRTQAVVRDLYRRFLARDPQAAERDIVAGLALDEKGKPVDALSFAKAACFAIASSTEFLFF